MGLELHKPILLKMALSFPSNGSTKPAAKHEGQLQPTRGDDWVWTTVLPDLSLLIKNLIISFKVQEEMHFGGDKEARKSDSCRSRVDFSRW